MQIQIISSYDDLKETFTEMFAEAVKSLPAKESAPAPVIIDGEELSKQLGVTIQTLIRWKHKGKIPYIQLGSSVRYDFNKVLSALEVSGAKRRNGK